MPGTAQWVETSVHTSPAEYLNDWINEKASYTLVFWSKNFARECQANPKYTKKEMALISKLLRKPNIEKIKE